MKIIPNIENAEQPAVKFVLVESPAPSKLDISRRRIDGGQENYSKEELSKRGIIHPGMKDQSVLTAFRDLRTQILPKMKSFNSCILVSSLCQGGGASFNAVNLSTAFTFDRNRSALLVDCNFSDGSLADSLGSNDDIGLFDYLNGDVDDVGQLIQPTIVPRLSLVPSGKVEAGDHIEFFTDERMRNFLEEIINRYDDRVIVLDAPPILESADTKILSEFADYVLLVLPYRGISPKNVERTIKTVGQEKIIGFVLNN